MQQICVSITSQLYDYNYCCKQVIFIEKFELLNSFISLLFVFFSQKHFPGD